MPIETIILGQRIATGSLPPSAVASGSIGPGQIGLAASQQFTTASSAGTTSTSGVMAGLGYQFTPQKTGIVRAVAQVQGVNSVGGQGIKVQIVAGSGAPPANGVAATGTPYGQSLTAFSAASGNPSGMFLAARMPNLGVGTPTWIDLTQTAITSGTALVQNVLIEVEELQS